MFDETELLEQAAATSLEQAAAAKLTADELYASSDAAADGLRVELDSALDSLRKWQGRIKAEPADAATVLLKLSLGSSKVSLAPAGQMYAQHESEQKVVRGVIVLKERGVPEARARLAAGELSLMRADLERQKAAAILLAVKHLEAEKMVHAADASIEVPLGDLLTGMIDNIVALQLEIHRRQS